MTSPAPHYPDHDTVFTWAAPPLRIGLGAVEEVAFELARFAPRRVLLITDGNRCNSEN